MENENALTVLPFSTPVGLNLPADFSIVAWAGYARAIKVWDCAGQFFLGDLMIYSQSKGADYEQEATQIVANLDFAPGTLQNAMWMARRFPVEMRRPGVDYTLYREVAGLPNEDALPLLDYAINDKWTSRELAKEVRRRKKGGVANETVVSSSNANGGRVRTHDAQLPDKTRAVEVEDAVIVSPRGVEASAAPLEKPYFEEKDLNELQEALFAGEKPTEVEVLRLIADLRRARQVLIAIDLEVGAICESEATMGAEDIEHLTRIAEILDKQLRTSEALTDAEAVAG